MNYPYNYIKEFLMSKFQIVKISNFLKSREERYKPDDTALSGLKRLDKIDFNGNIHQSEKPTKTDMIIVYPGDLVISGINVQKGAIAVYQGKEPITATIHYSSYTFDRNKIDIEYFKRFLKSPEFLKALQEQVKGGIKTEIKPKTFLPIEIKLPDLIEQQKINKYFDSFEQELRELKSELNNQEKYITQLKQAILQEAISGQLTAEWRKQNPIQKGDPNTDATALLAKIKAEKQQLINDGKLKKEKPLPEILPDEIPFSLPDSWVWCRLGEISDIIGGFAYQSFSFQKEGINQVLRLGNIRPNMIVLNTQPVYINALEAEKTEYFRVHQGDILITMTGTRGKKDYLYTVRVDNNPYYGKNIYINQRIGLIRVILWNSYFANLMFKHNDLMDVIFESSTGSANQANIGIAALKNWIIPLPPLAEQKAIVEKVDYLMKIIDQLEAQIKHRKQLAEDLMQTVLREAFV